MLFIKADKVESYSTYTLSAFWKKNTHGTEFVN